MSRPVLLLSIVLGLAVVGLGTYAWHLQRRLASVEVALALRAKENPARSGTRPPPTNFTPSAQPAQRNGDSNSVDESPERRRLIVLQNKAALDWHYAVLFKQLALTSADLEKLKTLIVEKELIGTDAAGVARAQGLNPRDSRGQIQKIISGLEGETDVSIRALLGEAGFQRYRQYEQTQTQRTSVTRLEQQLSFSSTPLYGNQSEKLVSLLAAAASEQNPPNPESIVMQSAGFLSPPQVDAFRQLLQDQAAQAELRQQMQQARSAARPGAPEPVSAAAGFTSRP